MALFLGMFGIQYFVAWPRRSGEIGDQSNQKYDTKDLFEWAMFLFRHRQGWWLNFFVLEHLAFAVIILYRIYTS